MADTLSAIEAAKHAQPLTTPSSWQARDIILYNLAVGAGAQPSTSLHLLYENDPNFQALPTFGVAPAFDTTLFTLCDVVPNYSLPNLLHVAQNLEIRKFPVPREAKVVSYSRLIDVLDKGRAAIVVMETVTKDAETGEEIFYNQSTFYVKGGGGFGGRKGDGTDTAAAAANTNSHTTRSYQPPNRPPDATVSDQTSTSQAALYRLCGDRNPVHIDPAFSRQGGLDTPILHGLCTFGFSGRHTFETFGPVKNIRARFVGMVLPGQTLTTEMWRERDSIIFQTKVLETGKLCVAGGGAELLLPSTRL